MLQSTELQHLSLEDEKSYKKLQELLIHQGPPTIIVDVKLKNSDFGELITHFNFYKIIMKIITLHDK